MGAILKMDVKEELKTVRDVFKDFNTIGQELMESKLKKIDLFKKTNTLEITLGTCKQIKIKDIYGLEKYLEIRFGIANIHIKVEKERIEENENNSTENENNIESIENFEDNKLYIQNEWNDIIDYMSYKHPMTKAIMKDSSISIENNNLNVLLKRKGMQFLKAKNFEEILSAILLDIYG